MFGKKKIVLVVVALLMVAGVAGFYLLSGEEGNNTETAVAVGQGGFPASARDAKVYSQIEEYLQAQRANERDKVLGMLSPEHRLEWTDNSYLLTEQALAMFDEIRLGELKIGVIDFNDIEGKSRADVLLSYILFLVKDNQVTARVDMAEDLGLIETGDGWLIDRSVRTVVMEGK